MLVLRLVQVRFKFLVLNCSTKVELQLLKQHEQVIRLLVKDKPVEQLVGLITTSVTFEFILFQFAFIFSIEQRQSQVEWCLSFDLTFSYLSLLEQII